MMARSISDPLMRKMREHKVNGVRELGSGAQDAAIEITAHLHAILTYMGSLVADPDGYSGPHMERRVDTLNREIVAGAFDGLAYMAGLANFFATEME